MEDLITEMELVLDSIRHTSTEQIIDGIRSRLGDCPREVVVKAIEDMLDRFDALIVPYGDDGLPFKIPEEDKYNALVSEFKNEINRVRYAVQVVKDEA